MTTPDPAPAQPPTAEAERRAARQARREVECMKRDAEDAERARADQRIDEAATAAVEVLPNGVGTAVAALLDAMKPWRASDGHMSVTAIGRSSPEVLALADALLATQSPIDPVAGDLEQAIEALHVALDEHDDSTCNMRSNGVVDGYDHDIVRALLLAGWTPPFQPPPSAERGAEKAGEPDRNEAYRELRSALHGELQLAGSYLDGDAEDRICEALIEHAEADRKVSCPDCAQWSWHGPDAERKLFEHFGRVHVAQPPPPDTAEVLAGLRAEVEDLAVNIERNDPYTEAVRDAIALVEAAERRLGEGREGT